MEENWKDLDNMEEEFDEEYDVNIIVNEETGEKFEVLDNFEIDGKVYYVMILIGNEDEEAVCDECGCDCADDEHDEVYIYRLVEDDEYGEFEFVAIEDEVELANAFEEFKSRNNELFDFDEDELQ
jgi:hypothetical protein